MSNQQVWFVTGASKGFGFELVSQLLQQGHRVAATSRDGSALQQVVGIESADFLPMTVDLVNEESVRTAILATINQFGRIDVIVNNAGYGQLGSLEEVTDTEARTNFDVNVFGALNVIRQAMPQLRKQQAGHIFTISSIAGLVGGFPGWGIYCATKFAVEGFSEALAVEVAPLGIHVTIVEPGYFRTNFLKSGSLQLANNKLDAYTLVRESEAYHHQLQLNGNQPGDPVKAATAIINVAAESNPPQHLLLGTDAYALATAKIQVLQTEIESWKGLTLSTDF